MTATSDINRERIAATEAVIRPHIRRTPLVQADLADFGLPAAPVTLKLEMLQHSGSFKARGAFANLLLRQVPQAGVVAASGGNHGAAVAYAAQRLEIPATIFVPDITSPCLAADSLAPRRVGELMFPIARAHVERVVLVSDDAIRQTQAALWSRLRLVVEPGGAAAFAALLSGRYRPSAGERVAVLVCGANTTAVNFES